MFSVCYEYGILEFSSKSRIQSHGVMFRPFVGGKKSVVVCHKSRSCDVWAKIEKRFRPDQPDKEPEQHLVEILGEVGKADVEKEVLRLHYHVQPCKYPDVTLPFTPLSEIVAKSIENFEPSFTPLIENAITVDNIYTLDRDDAISMEINPHDKSYIIGIHITDTTRLPVGLLSWARSRGASAYWSTLDGQHHSKPMLPPILAHESFSLNKDTTHPCISLFLYYDKQNNLLRKEHKRTRVKITANLSYDEFEKALEYRKWYKRLKKLSKETGADEVIAWLMIQYNFYFSEMLVTKPGILLRSQPSTNTSAKYTLITSAKSIVDFDGLTHASMNHRLYGHFTSPIRRYADMNNQFVLFDMLEHTEHELDEQSVEELNARMTELQHFHYQDTIVTLAYLYKDAPALLDVMIKVNENGRFAFIDLPERRVKIPLYDSYYSEPLHQHLKNSETGTLHRIELFGIHKNGQAQLRIRFEKTYYPDAKNSIIKVSEKPLHITVPQSLTNSDQNNPLSSKSSQYLSPSLDFQTALERIEEIAGYNLDSFQRQALQVMIDGYDVLGMAPTGSGKTILAMMAIVLFALDKNKRAIFTSPIKALSNQKYYEFTEWLKKLPEDLSNRITLLTGDIQARATIAGGDDKGELLIMTSEILANKLENSRIHQKLDPDLENVSIVVMDEVHYINDADRGHVWETTLMNLPPHIQIIALSATLNEPHRFCDWMSRRKETCIVQRYDRHVPLYIGGYDATDQFRAFFNTHAEHKTFATADYDSLYDSEVILKRMISSPSSAEIINCTNQLVSILEKDDKLPAIVFFMNRSRCVQCAEAIHRNLLLGTKIPPRKKQQTGDLIEDYKYEQRLNAHQEMCIEIRSRQTAMYRKYLLPFEDTLEQIPGFHEFKMMLDRGVAYHHAGMIPILREYVEILFQQKLIKVVFATETLGVGINMPARTTVFTQLDKPNGKDSFRSLRTDEFWQMAGRAGRRGMDTKGYVVYYPFEKTADVGDMRNMLIGKLPSARSQLKIDKLFVLKHLKDNAILGKTLLHHQFQNQIIALRKEIEKLPEYTPEILNDMKEYKSLKDKLTMRGFIKLTPKQRLNYEQDIKQIQSKYTDFDTLVAQYTEKEKLYDDIRVCETALANTWDDCMKWLILYGYATETMDLTIKGKTATMMCDGLPLVRAEIITNGALHDRSFEEIVTWLAFFSEDIRIKRDAPKWKSLPDPIEDLYDQSEHLAEHLNETLSWSSGAIMNIWCANKNIHEICAYVDTSQLGVFVKMILRVITYIDELKPILLGLGEYEIYNKLEGHHERLLSGVVTNQSLYVHHANSV